MSLNGRYMTLFKCFREEAACKKNDQKNHSAYNNNVYENDIKMES